MLNRIYGMAKFITMVFILTIINLLSGLIGYDSQPTGWYTIPFTLGILLRLLTIGIAIAFVTTIILN